MTEEDETEDEAGRDARVLETVCLALDCERAEDCLAVLDRAAESSDAWEVNAGIIAIGHLARRFRRYPGAQKDRLWARAADFPDAPQIRSSLETTTSDIAHFRARPD